MTIINPITSEPIVVVTRGDLEVPVIPAGTEIPFPTVTFSDLSTGEKEQDIIEIPICVGGASKIVSNLKIEDPRQKVEVQVIKTSSSQSSVSVF